MRKKRILRQLMRLLCLALTVILTVPITALSVSAAGKSYNIKDLGIQCTISDSFTHDFTRASKTKGRRQWRRPFCVLPISKK